MSTADSSTSARSWSRSKGAICYEHTRNGERERVRVPQDCYPYLESIDVIDSNAREYTDGLPDLSLPGSGELLYDCGEDIPALVCSERGCGSVYEVGRTCRRSRCPRCWKSWAFQRSKTVASKLDALRRSEYTNGNTNVKIHHLTVSFPSSTQFDSKDPLGRAIETVKSLLQQVNVSTGYIVYHPYRIAAEHQGEMNGHSSGDGPLTWKNILPLIESEVWDAVRDEYLIYSPHFHVVCLSEFVQGGEVSKRIEDKTGVVIERITNEDSSVSIYDLDDLCSVTAYALSHAGLSKDKDTETWRATVRPFGKVANFTAAPNVEHDVDRTLREVAPTVLGISFPKPECSEQRLDEDAPDPPEDSPAHGVNRPAVRYLPPTGASGAGGGLTPSADPTDWSDNATKNTGYAGTSSGTWDVPASAFPASIYEPDESLTSPCGGTLRPMWAADALLEDDDWMGSLPSEAARELHEAYARWQALGKPRPDTPPPD